MHSSPRSLWREIRLKSKTLKICMTHKRTNKYKKNNEFKICYVNNNFY